MLLLAACPPLSESFIGSLFSTTLNLTSSAWISTPFLIWPTLLIQLHFLCSLALPFCSIGVSLSFKHHSHSSLHLWDCYLLHSKSPPPVSLPAQIYLFFKNSCKVYFLSAAFSDFLSSYCFAANSRDLN